MKGQQSNEKTPQGVGGFKQNLLYVAERIHRFINNDNKCEFLSVLGIIIRSQNDLD